MTDPTGRSFLSYRRVRRDEAKLLVQAQRDHGIPTWLDVENLATAPTEDELRRVLADQSIASAVLFITPEVEASPIIRNVEVAQIIRRAEAGDGFFVVPLAAGGLDYAKAAEATNNHLSAQRLSDWNMQKISGDTVSPATAAEVAHRVLIRRLQAIHRQLPQGEHLRLGFFVRKPPPFAAGVALALDWSSHFAEKETAADIWQTTLLPALERIASAIRQHAPGREVEAFGLPTLPAAVALGSAFLNTSGLRLTWRQFMPDHTEQPWSLSQPRVDTGFKPTPRAKTRARGILQSSSLSRTTPSRYSQHTKINCPRYALWFTSPSPATIRTDLARRGKPPTLRMLFRTGCGRRGATMAISESCTCSWPLRRASRCS
jgi:hypothetical protein